MSATMPATIISPRKNKETEAANFKIKEVVKNLNREWDLGLELPGDDESPSKRPRTDERAFVFKITALCFKNEENIPLQEFDSRARTLYQGWINKPRADPDLIPEVSRHLPRPLSPKERAVILNNLLEVMTRAVAAMPKTPMRRSFGGTTTNANASNGQLQINDSPLPINLDISKAESKRSRDVFDDDEAHFKKPKRPSPPVSQRLLRKTSTERGRSVAQEDRFIRSADTSIASNISSLFDQTSFGGVSLRATQDTIPDESFEFSTKPAPNTSSIDNTQSSEFEGGSSLDAFVTSFGADPNFDGFEACTMKTEADEEVLQGPTNFQVRATTASAQRLKDSLAGIFPELPGYLLSFPLHVRYEIVRVFLHTETSLGDFKPPLKRQKWAEYDILWKFLKDQCEALRGKALPDQTPKEVWLAAGKQFMSGSRGVAMCGSLRYHSVSSTGHLFRFLLQPLRLERTYRLRRRFGNDRFLEIDIPNLTGKWVPKVLKDAGSMGMPIVIQWLREMHPLFGRIWCSFSTKYKDGRELKADSIREGDLDVGTAHRVFFFATDGDFFDSIGTPAEGELVEKRSRMSVQALLEWIRPTWENREQSYFKLYSRTPLALSRNTATVVLSRNQIIKKRDIMIGENLMTDGAGRLSLSLALKIVENMGLSYLPSGFQARLGQYKGFWVIDHRNNTTEDWIEVYDSQQKWKRTRVLEDRDYNDPAHRTFEVNKCSDKLKSADLNLQLLPILMEQAKSKSKMLKALKQILEDGLTDYLKSQREAMEKPELFRKWVRDGKPGLMDKLKHGSVPYKGAMPVSLEEKINMFLDAGFDPLKLNYLRELSERIYSQECEVLKDKLNITVPRSTYAYMVPDWTGILEADEVYIHPSECFVEQDKFSPMAGLPIQGIDVLVARSPAHFVSDIQRVKAVSKPELAGLKNIIVFSIKGTPCLAEKLSGGDYDGDLAWVTWEPTIVDNFVNAKYQKPRDLAKEGYITKDSTSYENLVAGSADPTGLFLQKSFEFNLGQNMLGICTKFKEKLCYTQETVNSKEAKILSSLLSCLVDQLKQGYIFTEEQWDTFRDTVIIVKPGPEPLYFGKEVDSRKTHIIDRLKYAAYKAIEDVKTDFHNKMPKHTPYTDDDLLTPVKWAEKQAEDDKDWVKILAQLTYDVEAVKTVWVRAFGHKDAKEDLKPSFGPIIAECYQKFCAIQPATDTPVTRALLEGWHSNVELSQWALLRASVTFATYPKKYVSSFVWWMAGTQLCHIKTKRCHSGMVVMAPNMYAMMKPDATFVKAKISEQTTYEWQKDLTDRADVAEDC